MKKKTGDKTDRVQCLIIAVGLGGTETVTAKNVDDRVTSGEERGGGTAEGEGIGFESILMVTRSGVNGREATVKGWIGRGTGTGVGEVRLESARGRTQEKRRARSRIHIQGNRND